MSETVAGGCSSTTSNSLIEYACAAPARQYYRCMNAPARHWAALIMLVLAFLLLAGRTMTGRATDEVPPTPIDAKRTAPGEAATSIEVTTPTDGSRNRREAIHNLVAEAQTLLSDVELQYVFTGEGKNQ